jgi:hypothetical protein
VPDRLEPLQWRAPYALGRRLRRAQLRVLRLEPAQLVDQRVVLVIADLGLVLLVVELVVVLYQPPQLRYSRS